MDANNEFYQNSMVNIRKDNDEWRNASGTCSPNLIEKSVNENGDYLAKDDNADGYSSVGVNVKPYFKNLFLSTPYITGYGQSLDFSLQVTQVMYRTDGNYAARTDSQSQVCMLGTRAKKIDIAGMLPYTTLIFNPDTDFEGFTSNGNPVTVTGASTDNATKYDTFVGYVTSSVPGQQLCDSIHLVKKTSDQFPFMCRIE
jgi:hypothetical protein